MTPQQERDYLQQSLDEAVRSVAAGGGPFAALIVHQGRIIARASNGVTRLNDPSAHAEVEAIRRAAAHLKHPHLADCTLYSSCMPCPMCLATALWAHIPRIVFAASAEQAAHAGFDDSALAHRLYGQASPVNLPPDLLVQYPLQHANAPFEAWLAKADRQPY